MRSRALHLLLVLAVCAAVYWPMLGVPGFGSSEGHRAGPAWEMLATGDFVHLRLFGLTYLRKPPGMPWAIAASSMLFGETEFAARAVSALASTIMALLAFWFTERWLGRPWGLAAGLAQATSPLFVLSGRSAEIDSLNCLGAQLGAFAMVSLIRTRPDPGTARHPPSLLPASTLLLALGLVVSGLVKGPANLPVLIGIAAAPCILSRSLRPLRSGRLWLGVLLAAILLVPVSIWFAAANAGNESVRQDFSEFTWSLSRLKGTAALIPAAIIAALPASAAAIVELVHPHANPDGTRERGLATILALGWLLSLIVLLLSGSSNARYAMPAGVLLAPLAAWIVRRCWLARHDIPVARVALLGHPLVWAASLLVLEVAWIQFDLRRPRHDDGRVAGAAIAAALPEDALVWCNDLVEARPDVLLYAQRSAASFSRRVVPLWAKSQLLAGELPATPSGAPPAFLLLREDEDSKELSRYQPALADGRLRAVSEGRVASYRWILVRVLSPERP